MTAPSASGADFVLSTAGLVKRFMGFTAVDGVSLRVRRGSVHALLGPNGAGKTTCFNMITGFLAPSEGSIHFEGQPIHHVPPTQVARRGLVRSFQISAVFGSMTVLENVHVALQRRPGSKLSPWHSARRLRRLDPEALHLLEQVGLSAWAHSEAGALPYGRKRALELATTLALNPTLMLLDEPFAGMAHGDVERMAELVKQSAVGRTVLMVEHNMSAVASICDRISVLARGKVLAEGSYSEVTSNPSVIEAYLGDLH